MLETTLRKVSVYAFITMILVLLIGVGLFLNRTSPEPQSVGSVGAGSVYQHTNLAANTDVALLIKATGGTFGSDIINVLGTGSIVFYDASTTNANLRTVAATSSLPVVAYRAASQAAGTYTYDIGFYNGLIASFTGTQGTSTISWR